MAWCFLGCPPPKKNGAVGFLSPVPEAPKGMGKGKGEEGAVGLVGGAASAHLLRGLRGPDERGSSPPWGRGGGGRVSVLGTTRRCVPGGPRCPGGEPGGPPAAAGLWMWPCPPAAPPHLTVLCLGVHVPLALVATGDTGGRGGPGGPVPDPTPLSPKPPVDILGGSRAPPPLTLLVLSGEAVVGAGRAAQRAHRVPSSRRCATTPRALCQPC